MFRNIFLKRSFWYHAYGEHEQIFNSFIGNPFFMEAGLKHHIDVTDFTEIKEKQLKQTLDDLFLNKHTVKYMNALDQRLFKIKDLALCTDEERKEYLERISNNEQIKLREMIEKKTSLDIDEIAGFMRPRP
ncbi:MAG: hypothetical protein EBQ95_00280 [Gammaproteobacteria bacterium]|nr:hypothetical protein [Gammaproteobacteria bacterium]